MKYNKVFYFFTLVFIATSCTKQQRRQATTMDISYVNYSSLDDSKLFLSGRLTYTNDTVLYYNLVSADSLLFYRHSDGHGLLNLNAKTIDKDNLIDQDGRPAGGFEYELIPRFVTDTAFISDAEKDARATTIRRTALRNTILVERYYKKSDGLKDSLDPLVSEHTFLCYNSSTRRIYFELNVMQLSIAGVPFTQKDFKHYVYPDVQPDMSAYDDAIQQATEYKTISMNTPAGQPILDTIPNFNYYDLNGTMYSSKNVTRGFTLVELWYISCAPCLKNVQSLSDLYSRYKTKNVNFIILNDTDQSVEKIKDIRRKYAIPYDLFYRGDSLKKILNIAAHPHTIIYSNRTRQILYQGSGTGNDYTSDVSHVLDSLLNPN